MRSPEYWDCWTMTDSLQWRDCQSVETVGVHGLTAYSDATARVLRLPEYADWQPTATRPPEYWDCRSTGIDSLRQHNRQSIETTGVWELQATAIRPPEYRGCLQAYSNTTVRVSRLTVYRNWQPTATWLLEYRDCQPTASRLPEYRDCQPTAVWRSPLLISILIYI